MYGFYYDPTYVMVLIGVVICMRSASYMQMEFMMLRFSV